MQLSYAQNLEDYHLSLIFADQANGTYIDIGGGHPVADNVSFWFYLKGWRGLVVEPQEQLASLYAHVRPRDSVEACLVGSQDGEAQFHEVEGLHGFSTTVESHAANAGQFGASYRSLNKPMHTLGSLATKHGLASVDFLKIDVEGGEADVLAGNDWRQLRPRVVLVEAIEPGSMAETWQGWETILTGNGYRFAHFDGLNRFYVAEEAATLAQRLPREKTPWDCVRHLYEFGRAPDQASHPDHALCRALIEGFLAGLPRLSPREIAELLARSERYRTAAGAGFASVASLLRGSAEFPGAADQAVAGEIMQLLDSDRVRAALGRIAATYDGGQLLD